MKIGILFDLDGTLLDTLEDLICAVNHTLRHFGYPERTGKEIRRFLGNGAEMLIRLSLPEGVTDDTVAQVLSYYQPYYTANSQIKTGPYPGIPAALQMLKERFPLAIVSNKPDMAVRPLCRQYFGDIYARGESEDCPRKPAPDMVRKAMEAIGVDACIYVGDSDVDVLTARNAGVPCVSVTWGFQDRPQLEAAEAKVFCDDPAKLPDILQSVATEYYGI